MPTSTLDRPWRHWYDKARWDRRRKLQLQKDHYLCVMHLACGAIEPATVVDHVVPHNGDEKLFWFGDLQSLCVSCHNNTKQQLEGKGFVNDIGFDGWPVDPKHPVNIGKR